MISRKHLLAMCSVLLVAALLAACAAPVAPPTTTPVPPTPIPPAPTPSLLDFAQTYESAWNSFDPDALTALFAEPFTFNSSPITDFNAWYQGWPNGMMMGSGGKIEVRDCQMSDDTVTCTMAYDSDCFDTEHIEDWTVHDGKITELVWRVTPEEASNWDRYETLMNSWATAQNPPELSAYKSETAKGLYDYEWGVAFAALCKQYESAQTQATDPTAVAQAWMNAISDGDVDAALALVTDDVSFRFGGEGGTGPTMMGGHLNWWAGIDTKYHIFDCQTDDDKASCKVDIVDGCIAVMGYPEGLPMQIQFVVAQDGKIGEISAPTVGPEWDDYWRQVSLGTAWMQAYRAEELAKRDWSREYGPTQLKMCQDFAIAKQTQAPATAKAAQDFVDAVNSGDTDAALALFMEADDVSFKVLGDEARGAEELLAMFDWLAGKETQFQITDCEWQGIGTQCAASLVDGCIAASGAPEGVNGKMTFYSQEDGTLRRANVVMGSAERKAYNDWLEAETAWAAASRADALTQAEGYSTDAGAMQIKLCQEYAAAQAQDPTAVVQAWLEALNNGDLDAALALMTPDAVIPGWGSAPARNVLDWWIDIKSHFGAPDCQETGDRLVCSYTMTDDGCITAFGNTAGLPLRYTFDMQDGKIRSVNGGEVENDDWSRYGKWSEEMEAWTKASRAEEWAKIDLTTFGEGGEIIIKLCQEYAETLK